MMRASSIATPAILNEGAGEGARLDFWTVCTGGGRCRPIAAFGRDSTFAGVLAVPPSTLLSMGFGGDAGAAFATRSTAAKRSGVTSLIAGVVVTETSDDGGVEGVLDCPASTK